MMEEEVPFVPPVCFGTGSDFLNRPPELLISSMLEAWELGYRFFDTAMVYRNETVVGEGLKRIIEKGARRSDIIVQTKVFGHFYKYQEVIDGVNQSLKNLGVDYIDFALHHFPGPRINEVLAKMYMTKEDFENRPKTEEELQFGRFEVWRALQDCKKSRKIRHIGVSNYTKLHLEPIIRNPRCDIKPELNQIEVHPHCFDRDVIEFCQNNNIIVQAYAPLGTGRTDKYIGEKEEGFVHVLDDPVIREIARNCKMTEAQVCLTWLRKKGITIVVKSENKCRLKENFESLNCELSYDDVCKIDKINVKRRRFCDPYSTL